MREGQLLEVQEIDKMYVYFLTSFINLFFSIVYLRRHIPTIVVQGRYDVICPVRVKKILYSLHERLLNQSV